MVGGPGPWPVAVDWGAGAGDGTDDHPESKAQQHRGKNMQCPPTTPPENPADPIRAPCLLNPLSWHPGVGT